MSENDRPRQIAADLKKRILEEPNQTALALLFRAYSYARNYRVDDWQFAVEIEEFREAGLTSSEFRWLTVGGYSEHALEATPSGSRTRKFKRQGPQQFTSGTCFILTESCAELWSSRGELNVIAAPPHCTLRDADKSSHPLAGRIDAPSNGIPPDAKPQWDAVRRELRVGDVVVKHFKWAAGNQETVLTVFEEEGWP